MQAEEAPWETVRSDPNLSVHEDDTAIVLRPAQDEPAGMGLAFYPGAKVEATAYASRLPGGVAQGRREAAPGGGGAGGGDQLAAGPRHVQEGIAAQRCDDSTGSRAYAAVR